MPSAIACPSAPGSGSIIGVHPLPDIRIGQAAPPRRNARRQRHSTAASTSAGERWPLPQDHVGEPVAEIEIALGIHSSDIAGDSQPFGAALRLGAKVATGAAGAVIGRK